LAAYRYGSTRINILSKNVELLKSDFGFKIQSQFPTILTYFSPAFYDFLAHRKYVFSSGLKHDKKS
ncbi:MAG: hypothetical protein NC400_14520, partial [Clostridium sp.]|nr:hypothetical protein [Clostridium sp.]